ncbi:MAG: YIP1 family protein [Azoarcus sp.]|nr:YIP1 family protein [Azoarcus sp.]
MDINKIIERVKNILVTPKTEWQVIANETTTVADLYKNWIIWLAAIPAIAGFVKGSLIGISVLDVTIRTPISSGIIGAVFGYALTLVMVYVVALIINALAPTFGGQKDQTQALKVIAYTYTASWVASMGQILPWIGLLIILAGAIYSIYLLYLGLPPTMKCPPEKAIGYTAVIIVCAVVLGIVIGAVVAGIAGPDMSAVSDANSNAMMEEIRKQMEAARQ